MRQYGRIRSPWNLYQTFLISQFIAVTQSCPTFCDPMAAARQASLSLTNSRSLLKFMSIELVTQMLTCLSQGLRFSGLSQ